MTRLDSCLYLGDVSHVRNSPKVHRLKYSVFQVLLDLSELQDLAGRLNLFSYNRSNWISFYDSDHGNGEQGGLRDYINRIAEEIGRPLNGGKILLLCMPRIFGFVFNPISIYYCYNSSDRLEIMVYEVRNTFKQKHTYAIPVDNFGASPIIQGCRKDFYVSPYMDMGMVYRFALTAPGASLSATIRGETLEGAPMIFTVFRGRRVELTDRALVAALIRYPLLTLGVVAAIHWEALKLFAKGLRLRRRPPAPADEVTFVGGGSGKGATT